jgi:hypothetical protein
MADPASHVILARRAAHPAHGIAYALKARNVLLLAVRIFRENVPILPDFVGEWIEPDLIESFRHPPNMRLGVEPFPGRNFESN